MMDLHKMAPATRGMIWEEIVAKCYLISLAIQPHEVISTTDWHCHRSKCGPRADATKKKVQPNIPTKRRHSQMIDFAGECSVLLQVQCRACTMWGIIMKVLAARNLSHPPRAAQR